MAVRLVLAKHGYHKGILLRLPFPFDIVIIAAPGKPKDLTHNSYRIFCLVTVDNLISILRPHILSVSERKSRSSSFSILSRLFSYLYSCNVFAGFRPRVFGTHWTAFLRSRFSSAWT